jgi:Periplasmic binding protein
VQRTRWIALALAGVLGVAACGGGTKTNDNGGSAGGSSSSAAPTTPTTSALEAKCKSEPLQSTEIGVTADTITIAIVADTGSSLRPGLFQGSVDAINAWANYKNANGGLGCRKVAVKFYDSALSATNTKNALTSACSNTYALVGTTALFVNDVSPIESCKDKAGQVTGIPDLAELQTEPAQQCSNVSYAILPTGAQCPYSGTGPRTYKIGTTPFEYYLKKFGKDALHGVWVIPADLPSTISASMPGFRYSQKLGIRLDAEFGASGLATEPAYTPFAQAIKNHKSTYARVGLDYKGTVYLRKEAQAQGVNTVKVWDCSVQCYDKRMLSEGGSAVEGQYVWMTLLPFEDAGSNQTLDNFLKYDKKPDGFGEQAWAAAELFGQVVDQIVATKGPNALTRANLLEGVRNTHSFDAGGLMQKTDIGGRAAAAPCMVMMQIQNGKFVRVDPTKPGTYDCSGSIDTFTIDPTTAFKG